MTTEIRTLSATPPACLTGETASARWTQTINDLAEESRTLPCSNEGVLIGYCAAFQLLADCERSIAKDGLLLDRGREGQKRSPALTGKISALSSIKGFASELGLSPT